MPPAQGPHGAPQTHPPPGSVIGDRYRIERLIDEGAMGRVYLAQHIHMRKLVAIKVLRRELTRVPEVMARFEREAMAAAHIDHPNVAIATDFGKLPDGSVYLVLEYVEGRTLRQDIAKGPLPVTRALGIGRQVASALAAAHALDIVHRDLKPENVMLVHRGGESEFVKVLDFGVAKVPIDMTGAVFAAPAGAAAKGNPITKAGMVFGTPDYMAPEQALGQEVDARADIYSLGVMLYEMLCGVRPFKSNQELGILGQQLAGGPPPFKQRAPAVKVPGSVERLVRSLLVNEPSERPGPAHNVAVALGQELERLGERVEPLPSVPGEDPVFLDSGQASGPGALAETGVGRSGFSERILASWPLPAGALRTLGMVALPLAALAGIAALMLSLGDSGEPRAEPLPSADVVGDEVIQGASKEQIEQAMRAGDLAMTALMERYPHDAHVMVGHARMLQKTNRHSEAMKEMKRALDIDPSVRDDAQLATALWLAVQRKATEADALRLLKGPMQSRGADIFYDLATTKGVKSALVRAARDWMQTRDFEKVSTPQAAIAAKLLLAKSCEERKALVSRAEAVGDQRSVGLIKRYLKGEGCDDKAADACNGCLDAAAVEAAITAISKREGR